MFVPGIILALMLATQAQTNGRLARAEILPQVRNFSFTELDRAEAMARYGHPNEMWRYRALRAMKLDQAVRAAQLFTLAARYGDKPSQHALSLMYWHGVGVAQDRAQAYVWSDLAAERGYRDLLVLREKMWMDLTADQQTQALKEGLKMYAEYGDAAAKPRMESEMRKAIGSVTGSRLGFTSDRVKLTGPFWDRGQAAANSNTGVSENDYFADGRWNASRYWRGQDKQWKAKVIVLPPETMPATDVDPSIKP